MPEETLHVGFSRDPLLPVVARPDGAISLHRVVSHVPGVGFQGQGGQEPLVVHGGLSVAGGAGGEDSHARLEAFCWATGDAAWPFRPAPRFPAEAPE